MRFNVKHGFFLFLPVATGRHTGRHKKGTMFPVSPNGSAKRSGLKLPVPDLLLPVPKLLLPVPDLLHPVPILFYSVQTLRFYEPPYPRTGRFILAFSNQQSIQHVPIVCIHFLLLANKA